MKSYIVVMGSMRLVSNSRNNFPFFVYPMTVFPWARKILSFGNETAPPNTNRFTFGPGSDLKSTWSSPLLKPACSIISYNKCTYVN